MSKYRVSRKLGVSTFRKFILYNNIYRSLKNCLEQCNFRIFAARVYIVLLSYYAHYYVATDNSIFQSINLEITLLKQRTRLKQRTYRLCIIIYIERKTESAFMYKILVASAVAFDNNMSARISRCSRSNFLTSRYSRETRPLMVL